jgi:hypothetical protein
MNMMLEAVLNCSACAIKDKSITGKVLYATGTSRIKAV